MFMSYNGYLTLITNFRQIYKTKMYENLFSKNNKIFKTLLLHITKKGKEKELSHNCGKVFVLKTMAGSTIIFAYHFVFISLSFY